MAELFKAALVEKAAELKLIDGYCLGSLTVQQVLIWLNETTKRRKEERT